MPQPHAPLIKHDEMKKAYNIIQSHTNFQYFLDLWIGSLDSLAGYHYIIDEDQNPLFLWVSSVK